MQHTFHSHTFSIISIYMYVITHYENLYEQRDVLLLDYFQCKILSYTKIAYFAKMHLVHVVYM